MVPGPSFPNFLPFFPGISKNFQFIFPFVSSYLTHGRKGISILILIKG
jgi:hypothetical protein